MAVSAYYQTFVGLDALLKEPAIPYTDVFVAAIHTDTTLDDAPCLHLNDLPPDDPTFDACWAQAAALARRGVRVAVMLGGAGGAFARLFEEYETYVALVVQLLKSKPFVTGIDLDVEECLDDDPDIALAKIRLLIHDLRRTLGPAFRITLAPVQGALTGSGVGMGGFSYVDLWRLENENIAWLNGQFYGAYTVEAFDAVVAAGFPAARVLAGMMSCDPAELEARALVLHALKTKYPDFGGAFLWEYADSPSWGAVVRGALADTAVVVEMEDDDLAPLPSIRHACSKKKTTSSSSYCAIS
jgi:hypothetical protein